MNHASGSKVDPAPPEGRMTALLELIQRTATLVTVPDKPGTKGDQPMASSVWPDERYLAGTPWSIRLGRASQGQPALEVYDAEILIDVVVATPVAPEILRGARRAVCRGHPSAVAWGRLPADFAAPTVLFTQGRRHRDGQEPELITVGGFCWLAVIHGRFNGVTVNHPGARCGRLRLRKDRRW
jgi:hypothetical protein